MHVSVNFFHDFSLTLQGTKRETQKLGLVGKFKETDSIDAWEIPTGHASKVSSCVAKMHGKFQFLKISLPSIKRILTLYGVSDNYT
jgi:hypothetical protein